jgi:hypothetical protein
MDSFAPFAGKKHTKEPTRPTIDPPQYFMRFTAIFPFFAALCGWFSGAIIIEFMTEKNN